METTSFSFFEFYLGHYWYQANKKTLFFKRRSQDVIIIISYASMDFEEAKTFKPNVVFPKAGNKL